LPWLWFSVGRAAHSKAKPDRCHKARYRGQINRYKANDLPVYYSFSGDRLLIG